MPYNSEDVILILDVEDSYNLLDIYPEDLDEFKIIIPTHTIQYGNTDDNYTIAENVLDFISDIKEVYEYHSYYDDTHHHKVFQFNLID